MEPLQILQAGGNYLKHVINLALLSYSNSHAHELELAAVIGKQAFRFSPEDALEYVFGHTVVNGITTREYVLGVDMPAIGSDWYRVKNAPGGGCHG